MSTKWMRLLLCLILLATASGCGFGSGNTGSGNRGEGLTFSVLVGESELAGSSVRLLNEAYVKGISIVELFKKSGVVRLAADGHSILEVNKVALDPVMSWEIQVNGKSIQELNTIVEPGAAIVIAARPAAIGTVFYPVIITVNGGSEQPELTHSHVLPFVEDMSVRALMKNSGMVKLADDNRTVLTVMEYTPLSSEEWRLKVNDKALLGNGVDMKLKPQDKLEIALVLR
ncbi:hypothetical protein HQN87_06800 [Paenibacillus tritici]|jgi:hypothetical protein|uniref:Lipoprotein n=1 Tax=Paenibacillus tritici TaxID=1873425 RepID=A0ABX2DLS7_9BACL|nr:hypothetical protein [Paenibacillus tritici]NQX45034.1 hypothetical protein [Paenibacillus tritici]